MNHHVAFVVRDLAVPSRAVVDYFTSLGYCGGAGELPNQWRFHRGRKIAALFQLDIRAYDTDLVVKVGPAIDGVRGVSCGFTVWTLLNVNFSGDIAALEAEGRGLESLLHHSPR